MATDLVGVGPTLEADDWPDADSATGSLDDGGSETTSVDTSIMRYRLENGRSYHSFRDGRYVLPNDEREKDRLDLQHHMSLITLDNKLLLAPIDGDGDGDRAADGPPTGRPPVQRVLDVGTGTGIWAMDFADSHPSAQVIGNDLSAIQPRMVPSNCDFEVDDVEAEWTHRVPFDVVYCRMLVGSLKDWPRFFAQAFAHLRPAGWCETHNIDFPVRCDDGTLTPDHALYKWSANQLDGFNRIGSSIAIGSRYRRMMLDAGFERVSQVVHKWPVNAWPKGRKEKTLGAFEQENFLNGLQAFTLAIHTRVLGWSAGECELFMADVRKDIKNRSIHAYFPVNTMTDSPNSGTTAAAAAATTATAAATGAATASANASQKRPLDDSSSPSGVGDQPDAKRPALNKIEKAEGNTADHPVDAVQPNTAMLDGLKASITDAHLPSIKTIIGQDSEQDANEDTIIKDATTPTTSTNNGEPQPIQSTSSNGITNSQPPTGHQDESNWLHIRSVISSAEAATIIGKGGENVTLIRRMSGAKCTVSDYSRGAVERILTVSGLVDAVAKAFGLIIRTLNNEAHESPSTPQSKTYPLRLLIPHVLIGSIIGKSGVRIREIQDASGARLNASDTCLPLSTERSLVVLGVADAVHIATYYVGSTLVEQLTERFGGPAASAYATRSGAPAGVVPGGLQVAPYVPQHVGGQWGHPDNFRKHTNQGNRTSSNPYGIPYMHGQAPQAQAQAPLHYTAGSPRSAYTGAGPHQPQPFGGPQTPQQAPHSGPTAQPLQTMMAGQPMTQQIFIPNDMVGAIIGKGGAKINEIRQLSGSVIKINEPQDNSNERLVTITGTPESNQMALYMLYSRLGEFNKAAFKGTAVAG